ncbi:MAG: chromosomal replication initiator protein DnaA [Acidimicrobiales bacterium]
MTDARALWDACAAAVHIEVSEAVWQTTFNLVSPLEFNGRTLVLGVPNTLVKERFEGRFRSLVVDALDTAGWPGIEVVVQVTPLANQPAPPGEPGRDHDVPRPAPRGPDPDWNGGSPRSHATVGSTFQPPERAVDDGVNPRYTFEAFVTGASNRFAQAAALAVAEVPARSYNPLFIYGDAGLGKTHLLQAIAHYVRENYRTYRVRYVSTETFLNQYVDSIRAGTPQDFKRHYREMDVLLVDDIQFMEGKEGLQEEFFHTFNYLYEANRQIVLSSDRPPDAISTLEDRLRSRFKMGLITDIQPPDLETRLAILRKKAEQASTHVGPDVLEFIATHITNNIRELEGALIRVAAYASLNREPVSSDLAARVLADSLRDKGPRLITPILIMDETCRRFGFTKDEITGASRRRPLVAARQISMYVMRELTDLSYPAIAREFGGRDHTTVIHAVEKIGVQMRERRQIYDQVTELINALKSDGGRS